MKLLQVEHGTDGRMVQLKFPSDDGRTEGGHASAFPRELAKANNLHI